MSPGGIPRPFSWLRDGERIVAAGSVTVNTPLSIMDLASGVTRAITSGASRETTLSVSPDGETLAFASGELGYDIIEMPVEGSAPRTVISTARSEVSPAWAPDGVRFAYSTDRSGAPEIWLRNRADGSERRIVGSEEFPEVSAILDCAISPAGDRVAYRVNRRGSIQYLDFAVVRRGAGEVLERFVELAAAWAILVARRQLDRLLWVLRWQSWQ